MKHDPEISPAQQRENPEPHEQANPVPRLLLLLLGLLMGFGIVYICLSDIESPSVWGDGRQAAELGGGKVSGAAKADGAALFASLCAACHQANGQGLPGVFPPLAGSEWVQGQPATVAAILLHGVNGTLTVKGVPYRGAMPAFGAQLSDDEIAAVLSHIRAQWGNSAAAVGPEVVAQARAAHQQRSTPFDGDKDLPSHQ